MQEFGNITEIVVVAIASMIIALIARRQKILDLGGIENCNVFTKISLALFEQISWKKIPSMPVEIMSLPNWFPFHINKISY